MNGTFENDENKKLTVEQQAQLKNLAQHLRDLAQAANSEPINPKISDLLYIASDIAEEQVRLDTYYYYDECIGCNGSIDDKEKPNSGDYLFLDNNKDCETQEEKLENPSIADQITQWFEDGQPEREADE